MDLKFCIDARPLQNAHKTRGIGVLLKNLLSGIAELSINDEVTLVTLRGRELPRIFKNERRIETRRLERPNRFNWIADHLLLSNIVQQAGADIFFATDINSYLVPQAKTKVVSMAYDLIPFIFSQVMASQPLPVRIGWRTNFRKLLRSDAVIAISEATKNDLIKLFGIDSEKITVIYPGMDHSLFNRENAGDPSRQNQVLSRYGIEGKYLLYVGDSEWRKNLRRVLEALVKLDSDIRLVLVGKRARGDAVLHGWIRELGLEGRVMAPGFVPDEDLPPLYGAAEAFLFPSLYEGFGLPVIEAMACGCPVITSNVSSMPEIAGDAALLVDPTDVKQIAEAIKKVLNGNGVKSALSEAGVRRADFFSWEKSAKETVALIRSVAGK